MNVIVAPSYTIVRSTTALLRPVHRLRQITGFVTVYGERHDPRTAVFARVWHVRRVAQVARLLAAGRPDLDIRRVRLLTWLHDLNRWPFAHNTELKVFDQAGNTDGYLATRSDLDLSERDRLEVAAIQDKMLGDLSAEGRCVLLADAITGVIEDPLLLVCGLGVRPEVLHDDLPGWVGFDPRTQPWRDRALHAARLLRERRIRPFSAALNMLFTDQASAFIAAARRDRLRPRNVLDRVATIKNECIRPIVFPFNNDLVCHAPWLRNEVMPWYLDRFAEDDLVEITEDEFVDRVVRSAGGRFRAEQFRPDLDVVARDYPDLSFTV